MPKRQNETGNENENAAADESTEEAGGSQQDLRSLISDVANMRADMSSVTEALRALGESATASAGGAWRAASETMRPSVDTLNRTVQSNPVLSLLAAVGVGMILARVFSGRSRSY